MITIDYFACKCFSSLWTVSCTLSNCKIYLIHFCAKMRNPTEERDASVVKPGMQEYHTGHLPKPKFPTVKGAMNPSDLPQRAEFSMVTSVAPRPQRAVLWIPPITHYTLHYSRVDNYAADLNNGFYEDIY